MKLICKEYELFNEKIKQNCRVVSITDIHSNVNFLTRIAKELMNIAPDMIVISGDIIDSIDHPNNKKILELLKFISSDFPTFISCGNHDSAKFESKSLLREKEISTDDLSFFEILKKETNCIILGNMGIEEFKNLVVRSYNLSGAWYQAGENKSVFLDQFILNYYPEDDQYTILSSHSPNGYFDDEGKLDDNLYESLTDTLILSGHNHGGMIPASIQEKLSHTRFYGRGLVGPYRKVFPKNSYGYYHVDSANLIISNGVTRWSDCNGKIGYFVNQILQPEIDIIDLKTGMSDIKYKGYKVKK